MDKARAIARWSSTIRLLRRDCFAALDLLTDKSIDAIITDPPFGITDCAWDKSIDWASWWQLVERKLKPTGIVAAFACGKFTFELHRSNPRWYRYDLVWEKSRPAGFLDANRRPLRAHESILLFAPQFNASTYNAQKTAATHAPMTLRKTNCTSIYHGQRENFAFTVDGSRHPKSVLHFPSVSRGIHPTQKPEDLMRWLVRSYTLPGELVCDPFAGSGTTAIAAAVEGRRFFGCEKDASIFRSAKRRIEAAGFEIAPVTKVQQLAA